MAQQAGVCNAFKQALLNGGINLSSDSIKVALYGSSASLGPTTTAYTATGEIVGTGYTAGGQALTGVSVGLSGNTAYVTWNNPSWASSTLTNVTAALIYDATAGVAIAVLTFAQTSSSGGTFTLVFPAAGASAVVTLT